MANAYGCASAASRKCAEGDRLVRSGQWAKPRMSLARKFTGMRAGIIGLGRIGTELGRRLEGFKIAISYVDPVPRDAAYRRYPDAVTMAQNCDILFLCAAGAAKGKAPPIIGKAIIEALGPRGIFVNIARRWLV